MKFKNKSKKRKNKTKKKTIKFKGGASINVKATELGKIKHINDTNKFEDPLCKAYFKQTFTPEVLKKIKKENPGFTNEGIKIVVWNTKYMDYLINNFFNYTVEERIEKKTSLKSLEKKLKLANEGLKIKKQQKTNASIRIHAKGLGAPCEYSGQLRAKQRYML